MFHPKHSFWHILPPILAMGSVILISNILVQHPVQYVIKNINLAEILTWGAFTYPATFLVTDTTNRLFGPSAARRVVYIGFAVGVMLSLLASWTIATRLAGQEGGSVWTILFTDDEALSMLRVAMASGAAFLIAQLLDVAVFDRLRRLAWWKAPAVSSLLGSIVDTALFFSLAFAGTGLPWTNWAVGDFCAKLLLIALLLYPFRWLVQFYPASLRTV